MKQRSVIQTALTELQYTRQSAGYSPFVAAQAGKRCHRFLKHCSVPRGRRPAREGVGPTLTCQYLTQPSMLGLCYLLETMFVSNDRPEVWLLGSQPSCVPCSTLHAAWQRLTWVWLQAGKADYA